jgi:sugar lactone lactonase YvrE
VGTNTVKWSDIAGPKGHVFDPTKLEGLQFHVPTTTTSGGSYSFCISNLKLLM